MKLAAAAVLCQAVLGKQKFFLVGTDTATQTTATGTTATSTTRMSTTGTTRMSTTVTVTTGTATTRLTTSTTTTTTSAVPIPAATPFGNLTYMFQWQTQTNTTTNCNTTPPDLVFGFNVSDPLKTTKLTGETWPPFATYWGAFYPKKTCEGLTPATLGSGLCCISIGNPSSLSTIAAITSVDLQGVTTGTAAKFPSIIEGQTYCYLYNLGGTIGVAYKELYIKPDGKCYERIFRCFSNGVLGIYPAANCGGSVFAVPIRSTELTYSHPYTDLFAGRLVTFQGSTGTIGHTYDSTSTRNASVTSPTSTVTSGALEKPSTGIFSTILLGLVMLF